MNPSSKTTAPNCIAEIDHVRVDVLKEAPDAVDRLEQSELLHARKDVHIDDDEDEEKRSELTNVGTR